MHSNFPSYKCDDNMEFIFSSPNTHSNSILRFHFRVLVKNISRT